MENWPKVKLDKVQVGSNIAQIHFLVSSILTWAQNTIYPIFSITYLYLPLFGSI